MTKKKWFIIAGVSLTIFLLSISFLPSSFNCPKYVPSGCGLMENVITIVGTSVVVKSEIESFLLPGTDVLVEFDNGEVKHGKLTRKATSGRLVKSGDKVRLKCTNSFPDPQSPSSAICELEFLRFDPNSSCSPNSPCYGKIASWSISVDQNGIPDPQLLTLK